jgi:heme-degrading monooxygenase HmoA
VASPDVSAESPILLDIWSVDPSRRDELIAAITSTVQSVAMRQPGFVSAEMYQSVDRGIVLLSVSMRTVKDRQHLMDSPAAHTAMRELRTIAKSHTHLVALVGTFGTPSSPQKSS